MLQAAPASAEPTRNAPSAASHSRLAPNRPIAQPLSGIATARASRYPVTTHCTDETGACMPRPSRSIATLTTVVSSSGAIPPRISTSARARRLGPARARPAAVVVVVISAPK